MNNLIIGALIGGMAVWIHKEHEINSLRIGISKLETATIIQNEINNMPRKTASKYGKINYNSHIKNEQYKGELS